MILALLLAGPAAYAQDTKIEIRLPVDEFVLDNGMRVLVVERHDVPRVHCALYWKVGSVNERPGITGLSHFFEHMMFKGTKAIGTSDWEKDAEYNAKIEETMGRVREIKLRALERGRRGEELSAEDGGRLVELLKRRDELLEEQRKISVGEHLSKIFQSNGGTGLNASTSYDRTNYFVDLPSNKVELFFWLESDRFLGPVFREFYAERDVVKEERRRSCESTPTGLVREAFMSMFWQAHPYSWPVIGWMSDIDQYTMADAQRYYERHYSPQNCTAIFVGDVRAAAIHELARRYFGRLRRSHMESEPIVTLEPPQVAERRMTAEADANPSLQVSWHGPSQAHRDGTPLDVAMGVLSGRTGRLWRALVEERKLALSVQAGFWGLRYGGMITVRAEPRPDAKLEDLEAAIYATIDGLAEEGPTATEMRRVKNQMLGDMVRDLRTNSGISGALGHSEVLRDWRLLVETPGMIEQVVAADVTRVIREYLKPTGRNVLTIHRRETRPQ